MHQAAAVKITLLLSTWRADCYGSLSRSGAARVPADTPRIRLSLARCFTASVGFSAFCLRRVHCCLRLVAAVSKMLRLPANINVNPLPCQIFTRALSRIVSGMHQMVAREGQFTSALIRSVRSRTHERRRRCVVSSARNREYSMLREENTLHY